MEHLACSILKQPGLFPGFSGSCLKMLQTDAVFILCNIFQEVNPKNCVAFSQVVNSLGSRQ